jgi:hypothetical protein
MNSGRDHWPMRLVIQSHDRRGKFSRSYKPWIDAHISWETGNIYPA